MTDFRRWILALTVLALCVVGANAQVTGGTGGATLPTCTATNGAVTPTVRQEGLTELVGDIVISCTGGTAMTTAGTPIPQANITVFLNTQVTSRLLGSGGVTNASEALLLIDEPNTGLGGYGPTVPMTVCSTPASGCLEYIGTIGANANVPVQGTTAPASTTAGWNVFQGVVNPDGKSITFFGVPIEPVGTTAAQRIFRITNIRVNANAVPGTTAVSPGTVAASISFSGSGFVPLTQSQVTVGFVSQSLAVSLQDPTNTKGGANATFLQCNSPSSTKTSGIVGFLRYQSLFGTAFKTRVLAGTNANSGQAGGTGATAPNQSIPGSGNNAVSESGLILNNVTANVPTLTGNGAIAGLADYGTRFKAVFNNIPSGVNIYVSTNSMVAGTTSQPAVIPPPPTSISNSFAQLVISDTAPENGATVPAVTATGSNGGNQIAQLQVINGSATAVWEVVNSTTNTNQTFDFEAIVSYSYSASGNTPPPGSVITVTQTYAPVYSAPTSQVQASAAALPRFVDVLAPKSTSTWLTINPCTTTLLFPYIVSVTGFDTGLAISNTSMDPFSSSNQQTGTCTLNWYTSGGGTAGVANTPITAFQVPGPGKTALPIMPGTTWADTASDLLGTTAFQGYMIAQCNFQYGHGYAAITDTGSRGILTSYLALVMNGGARSSAPVAAEAFMH